MSQAKGRKAVKGIHTVLPAQNIRSAQLKELWLASCCLHCLIHLHGPEKVLPGLSTGCLSSSLLGQCVQPWPLYFMTAAVELHTTTETWTKTRQWRWGRSEPSSRGIHELKSGMRTTNTKLTHWEPWGREEVSQSETLATWQSDHSSTCHHSSSPPCKSSPER